MLFQIQNGTLSFGEKMILSHVDMEIRGKEKIGIVGPNGTGKTSLLKVIAGELPLDRDDKRKGRGITASRTLKISGLSQDHSRWLSKTVEEILLEGFYEKTGINGKNAEEKIVHDFSVERFYYEQKYDRMLQDFGFLVEDKEKKLGDFSGGEQTKLIAVKLLLTESDILLLDEPTNHLDEESVEVLEKYLCEYNGAVVMVSHDRYFLDVCADVIYELEDAHLKKYAGNYSAYRKEKRKQYEKQKKAYERQQEEIKRNEELIRQFKNKPRKAAFARSRKTMLERMERVEKPKQDIGHIFTGELNPEYLGPKWMLQMEELQLGFEKEKPLLKNLDLRIKRGTKIGIIGKNGIGKSTLLKTLTGQMEPLKGTFRFGEKVTFGYFDQDSGQIDLEETVAEHFHKIFPGMLEKELYGRLAAFLFRGSTCSQKISSLSGGEKARLRLCELLTLCPNLLILDEPTNHMDIPAKETLESAFQAYTGTILVVSHDRYFLDQVADAILVLEEGNAYFYPFGYTHYVQSRRKMENLLEKGVSLEELPGMLSTQEQAMISSLKAVPKAGHIESRQLSDDEAYVDWKLRLAQEPMENARIQVEKAICQIQQLEAQIEERLLLEWNEEESSELRCLKDAYTKAKTEYQKAESMWSAACIEWYDILNDAEGEED